MSENPSSPFQKVCDALINGDKLSYAAVGVGLFVAFLYFKIFFKDSSEFDDDSKESRKIPMLDKGYDYVNSTWSNGKITLWILLSIGSGVLAYHQLPALFPHWFKTP